jgi:hypothetical protein
MTKNLFTGSLFNNKVPQKASACCVTEKEGDVTTISFLDKVYLQDGTSVLFGGNGTTATPLTAEVKPSILNGQSFGEGMILYEEPRANLTNTYDAYVKNGALSSVTPTQVGDYDQVIVGATGNSYDSWYRVSNQTYSAKPFRSRFKVVVKAVGATNPSVGFRTVAIGAPYSNFTNTMFYFSCNLTTGVITTLANFTSNCSTASYNGWSTPVAVGETVTVDFEWLAYGYMRIAFTRSNPTEGASIYYVKHISDTITTTSLQDYFYPANILFDGTYQIIESKYSTDDYYGATLAFLGDSLLSGGIQLYPNTIQGQCDASFPIKIANFAGTTMYLQGMHNVLKHVIKAKPKAVLLCNTIDACFNGAANPASGGYAVWNTSFKKLIDTLIAYGIEPILMATSDAFYSDVTKGYLISWFQTNYPGRQIVNRLATEGGPDITNIHINATANKFVKDHIGVALKNLGLL